MISMWYTTKGLMHTLETPPNPVLPDLQADNCECYAHRLKLVDVNITHKSTGFTHFIWTWHLQA